MSNNGISKNNASGSCRFGIVMGVGGGIRRRFANGAGKTGGARGDTTCGEDDRTFGCDGFVNFFSSSINSRCINDCLTSALLVDDAEIVSVDINVDQV